MSLVDGIVYRLRAFFGRARFDRELDAEVDLHLSLDATQQRDAADASRAARRHFGNVAYTKEEARLASGMLVVDSAVQDVRFALRTLRRRPGFAAVAIATIALGIGAAASIYSVVDGVLFRPLPFAKPDQLVAVWQTREARKTEPSFARTWDQGQFSIPEYRDWRAAQASFDDVAIWGGKNVVTLDGDEPEQVHILQASASLLPTLGVPVALGRGFEAAEDVPGGPPVALVAWERWATRLGGDTAAIGRVVHLEGAAYTIVGVLPRGFKVRNSDVVSPYWVLAGQDTAAATKRGWHDFATIGRLKRGVTLDRAATEAAQLLTVAGDTTKHAVRVAPWQADQTRDVREPLLLLFAAAGILLLIACVNVATLLTGEAATRDHEIAARIAIGASRARLVRQLLTEAIALSAIGGVLGTLLAWSGTKGLVALAPSYIPGLATVQLDARVVAFALGATAVTGMLFGLVPAITASRAAPGAMLRSATGQSAPRGMLQLGFIAAELALSMVLLVGAGLLVRSFMNLTSIDPGFRTERLLTINVALAEARYPDSTAVRAFVRDAAARLAAVPGIEGVTATSTPPFSGGSGTSGIEIEGRTLPPGTEGHSAQRRAVMPGFFQLLGIPIVAGRAFTDADRTDAPLVVVITEALARREWPGESALGKRLKLFSAWRTVVGVAKDVKFQALSNEDQATVYAPLEQLDRRLVSLMVRTRGESAPVVPAIRAAIRDAAPGVPITAVLPMPRLIEASFAEERYRTLLISAFAAMAAVLAAVGMYGVTSRAVSRRTRELAIRMALGATGGSVVRLIIGYTLVGGAIGMAVGLVGAAAAGRVLAPFLFRVTATDPLTYVAILALLGAISVVASWIPARRATRVEAVGVLRVE